jgi:hypothetical protein
MCRRRNIGILICGTGAYHSPTAQSSEKERAGGGMRLDAI